MVTAYLNLRTDHVDMKCTVDLLEHKLILEVNENTTSYRTNSNCGRIHLDLQQLIQLRELIDLLDGDRLGECECCNMREELVHRNLCAGCIDAAFNLD